ncbi:MAG: LamG-like jellyroll fold domain-containing protein [Ferruginibacter sp.]
MKHLLFSALIIFCTISVTAQTTVGLIGYWRFSGNYTNTGTASATASGVNTSFTIGFGNVPNAAVQFQGNTGSYINFIDNGNFDFAGTNNFTVAFSFFFNGSSTSGLVDNCLNYGGWGVWIWSTVSGTWNLQFNYKNNSVGSAAATNFSIGSWHHATAVRNNGTISLYVDGIFRLSATEGTTAPTYPINMQAGAMCYGGYTPPRYNPFGGKIDELRIYNRALTAAEILIVAGVALPVKLTSFTAVNNNNNIKLQWQTEYEQNSSHYNIQRSTDGINFTDIGRVTASGNSNTTLAYSYTDPLPGTLQNAAVVFYRLQSVDIDGQFAYSPVVAMHLNKKDMQLLVFPNPVKDVLQVQTPGNWKGRATMVISDVSGRQLYKKDIELQQGSNSIPVNISLFSAGIYNVQLINGSERLTKQFIKE